jgi:hypothetical protein
LTFSNWTVRDKGVYLLRPTITDEKGASKEYSLAVLVEGV